MKKKFGNKFYNLTGGHLTKEAAEKFAAQYEKNGIETKIVYEKYEFPWHPRDQAMAWVVYTLPGKYRRPSKAKRKYREDGSIDGRPRF
jgi:hypothetical protein